MGAARKAAKGVRRVEGTVTGVGGLLGAKPALVIFLRPWRGEDGVAQKKELRVEVPVKSQSALSGAMRRWDGKNVALSIETVRKASGSRLEQNVARSPLRQVTPAAGLVAVAKEQARPKRVKSRVLGSLKLDRDMGWFQGERKKAKARYAVYVVTGDADNDKAVGKEVERAAGFVLRIEQSLPKIRDAIAAELLDTYNDAWREGGRPMSTTAFKRRQQLESMVIDSRRITLHFDCAGLFTDHVVEVRMSPRLKVSEVCLAG